LLDLLSFPTRRSSDLGRVSVTLWYPATGPFDGDALLDWLVSHEVPGLERTDPMTRETTRLVDVGRPVALTAVLEPDGVRVRTEEDRKSTRLNSSHVKI